MRFAGILPILAAAMPILAAAEPKPEVKPTIWKIEAVKDGTQQVTDGVVSATFPAEAKIKAEGNFVSADGEQKTGKKSKGYLYVERKSLPADAKKAGDPLKWLEGHAAAEV